MKEEKEILSRLKKETGFTVPENYFNDFAKNMEQSLPEKRFVDDLPPTTWQRVRTYVYMAAMFAGIWCMMNIFGSVITDSNQSDTVMTAETEDIESEYFQEYILTEGFSEYEIFLAIQDCGYEYLSE
ncbi:MAG: hypothetical protein R3Y22_04345 [Bacteroidales bacterium]